MSTMNGNPHYEESSEWVKDAPMEWHEGNKERAALAASLASAEATLALAYEQRTANLIAWVTANGETPTADYAEQINTRLGIVAPEPEPVKHFRSGSGKCNCGFNAYAIRGIMVDYHEALQAHLRRAS